MDVTIFLILLLFGIPIVALVCITLIILTRRKPQYRDDPEQTRMIQDIYNGLERMESRIDALETILHDPERKER